MAAIVDLAAEKRRLLEQAVRTVRDPLCTEPEMILDMTLNNIMTLVGQEQDEEIARLRGVLSDWMGLFDERMENEKFARALRGKLGDDETPEPHIRVFESELTALRGEVSRG